MQHEQPNQTRLGLALLDLIGIDVEIGWVINNIFESDLSGFLLFDNKVPLKVVAPVQGHFLVLAFLGVLQVKLWLQQVDLDTEIGNDSLPVLTHFSFTIKLQ